MLNELTEGLALRIEGTCAEDGWDRPATLWDIALIDLPDELRRELHASHSERTGGQAPPGADDDALRRAVDGIVLTAEVRLALVLEGHPFDQLVGHVGDEHLIGAALITEAWEYPDDVLEDLAAGRAVPLTPAEHPRRRSTRVVQLLLRNGQGALVRRHEDTNQVDVLTFEPGSVEQMHGRVADALSRYLDRPSSTPVERSARAAARSIWLHQLASLCARPEILDRFVRDMPADSANQLRGAPPGDVAVTLAGLLPGAVTRTHVRGGGLSVLCDSDHLLQRGSITGDLSAEPVAGSDEDLAEWDQARAAQVRHIEQLIGELDAQADDRRLVSGRPLFQVRSELEAHLTLLRWADAAMWSNSLDLPDDQTSSAALLEQVGAAMMSDDAAGSALHAAGWDSRRITEALDLARARSRRVGRNDPCSCGSGRKAKLCHPL